MKKSLILIGCGGHAKSIIEIIESSNNWKILGLIGCNEELNKKLLGYDVIGTDEDLKYLRESVSFCFISIGQIKNSQKRYAISEKLKNLDFKFPNLLASSSIVSNHAKLQYGISVGHGAIINAGANIGENCIINSNALIEHDVKVGEFSHISTGALVNGNVKIGKNSFIGSGSIIREGLEIPENSIIGAGQTILKWD